MKFLIAFLAGVSLVFTVTPVYAAPTATAATKDTPCHAHYAEWPRGIYDETKAPEGTWTTIQTCVVGGHAVRINSARWLFHSGECAVGSESSVSVWVDGVKVVDKRDSGDRDLCMNNGTRVITRVLVNDRMRLTVCELTGTEGRDKPYKAAELKPGQSSYDYENAGEEHEYFIQECTVRPIVLDPKARDPFFDGKTLKRTPPGLVLVKGSAPFCSAFTPAFAVADAPQLASILLPLRISDKALDGTDLKPGDDTYKTGEIAIYRLDVDNDGTPDLLTFRNLRPKITGYGPSFNGQYTWHSGATDKDYTITASLLGAGLRWSSDVYDDPLQDDLTFITIGGKTYVYKSDWMTVEGEPTYDAAELETMQGALPDDDESFVNRHIFELRNDGKAVQVCGWQARKRPEEFL